MINSELKSFTTGITPRNQPVPQPELVGSNPASPISRFYGEVVLSEEVPEGWRDGWLFQRATESQSGLQNVEFFL